MAQPPRFAPPTQMDALRTLLEGYSERDRGFQGQFQKIVETLRQLALPEMGQWLARTTAPMGLRHLLLEAVATFDWPEWDIHLMHMLQPEEDLGLFAKGCTALGDLCTRRAMEGLLRLKELRQDPERQELIDRELQRYRAPFAFDVYLAWLMEGASNPVKAHMAACSLAAFDSFEHLTELMLAFQRGDALTRHLALHVLAFHRDPDTDILLLYLFREARDEIVDSRLLETLLPELGPLSRAAQKERILACLKDRFSQRAQDQVTHLAAALELPGRRLFPELAPLRRMAHGPLEEFLVKAIELLALDKAGPFATLLRETGTLIPGRLAEASRTLDDIAALVAFKVMEGSLPLEDTLPQLEAAFHAPAGGEGLLIAYLRLIPPDDQARLCALLADPDPARRIQCIEALGAREEDALVHVFLQAMNDPDKEVAQKAIHQFTKLPSALPVMMDLFRSGQLERMREAIRFFHQNRTVAAAKPLLSFLASENPDELIVDAINALGAIADPSTAKGLLFQLHSGKPLVMQEALVEALTCLKAPAASLGLLKKSEELTLPPVLQLALVGSLAAFPSFEAPFPPDQVPALERLVGRCCDSREGAGQWLAAALGVQELFVFDQALYERLRERFNAHLLEMHQKPSWDRKSHDLAMEIIKKLSRRAASLSTLEERARAIEKLLEDLPPEGMKRLDGLSRLQEALSDPELVLSPACAQRLVAFLEQELAVDAGDYHDAETLCAIAGLSGQTALVEPLRELYARSTSLGRRCLARNALLALGLTESEIKTRLPIRTIVLLEPNAFFRKRVLSILEGPDRTIALAASREEAETLLLASPADLLISESLDAGGDLVPWIDSMREQRRCRYVLMSTSSHDIATIAEKPYVIGRLYKPYPLEELRTAIDG